MPWTDAEVRAALRLPVSGESSAGSGGSPADELAYSEVSTDTRKIQPGGLFVALRGEVYDAHDFLAEAVKAGARGAVVHQAPPEGTPRDLAYYQVPDTLDALGQLAKHRRQQLGVRVCAITGTNGKTTTKEMTRAALSPQFRVHATTGNLNNQVGAPLTILASPPEAELLVLEVGTSSPGEIARLAEIVGPDLAVITGVSEGHLERLGDLDGVLEEKVSLVRGLRPAGVALVSEEPPTLAERARGADRTVRIAGWSERADPDLRADEVRLDEDGRVRFRWAGEEVRLRFRGRAHARNALLALGVANEWGVEPADAAAALSGLEPVELRGELLRIGSLTIMVDCYNANPASLDAAVDTLVSMPRGAGRVAVVGTMRELGEASADLHRRSAQVLAGADLDLIVATGEFARAFEPLAGELGERLLVAEDPLEAYSPLAGRLTGRETVLLKGSRGVALERLIPRLQADWG